MTVAGRAVTWLNLERSAPASRFDGAGRVTGWPLGSRALHWWLRR